MNYAVFAVLCAVLATEIALVYELRQTRKEMRAIRDEIPKWVGISLAMNMLIQAVKTVRRNFD